MNAQALLSRLNFITDVPENIPRLRKLVIKLAISGRLASNKTETNFVNDLMSQKSLIAKEAEIATGLKGLAPIEKRELPRGCSDASRFERLERIAVLKKGLTAIQSAQPGTYPLVVTAEERSNCDHYDFDGSAAIIPMVSSTGHGSATLKRLHYQEGKFALGNILCAAFPISPELISARFIFEYLTAFKDELLISKMIGTANVSLTLGKIGAVPIPIVAPTVQRRIDELMAVCDELEEVQLKRENTRDKLVRASLHCVGNGASPTRESVGFYLEHISRLTTRSEHIQQLRQAIRDVAARGILVRQNGDDEPVATLLQRLQRPPGSPTNRRAMSKRRSEPKQLESQIAFPLPRNWEAIDFGSVCSLITSGSRGWAEFYASTGSKFIRAQNIRFGRLQLDDLAYVNLPSSSEGTRTRAAKGDLVIVITGAGVTNPALLETDLGEAYVSQHVALIKPKDANLSRWLLLCLMSLSGGRAELIKRAYGAGKPGLNLDNIRSLPIPLPPLPEQQRIIAKVDELMEVCDRLDDELNYTVSGRRDLMEAILNEAVGANANFTDSRITVHG